MERGDPKSLGIALILLAAVFGSSCSKDRRPLNTNSFFSQDTLNYQREDYDLMREYFRADSAFNRTLDEKIVLGEENAVKIKALLKTEYEFRFDVGIPESEIKSLILAYYTMKKASDRFREIDSNLLKTEVDVLQSKTDSTSSSLESLKKSLIK